MAELNAAIARARDSNFINAYDGARKDRTREDWLTSKLSPDAELAEDLETLRERSIDLAKSDPHAAGWARTWLNNVAGTGIAPNPAVAADDEAGISEEAAQRINRRLDRLWRDWAPLAGIGTPQHIYALQRLVARSLAVKGEAFVLWSDKARPGKPIPLALQVIHPARIETPPEQADNERLRLGIEYDADGDRLAYWVRTTHPGDTFDEATYERFTADRIWHVYEPEDEGQSRGVPRLTPSISRIKDGKELDDTLRIAYRVAACFAAFITSQATSPLQAAKAAASEIRGTRRIETLAPGIIRRLAAGEDVRFAAPSFPGDAYGTWHKANVRASATGAGSRYELFANDLSESSYSAARLALLLERLSWLCDQATMEWTFWQPLWKHFVGEAVMLDQVPGLSAEQFGRWPSLYTDCEWIPTSALGWIDPVKEVEATIRAIEANLTTHRRELAALGLDLDKVFAQRAREKQTADELGIAPPPKAGAAAPQQRDPSDRSDPPDPSDE